MKKLVGLLALLVACALPGTALAHPHAVTDRRIAALERKVRTLQTQVRQLRYWESCRVSVVGISQYTGFLWDPDGAGPLPPQYDTALDADTSPTPQVFVERFAPQCVQTGSARVARARAAGERALTQWEKRPPT
jgi:hypothetical protein